MHLLKAYVLIDSTRMVSAKRQVERGSTNINIIARPYFWDICRISTVLARIYQVYSFPRNFGPPKTAQNDQNWKKVGYQL